MKDTQLKSNGFKALIKGFEHELRKANKPEDHVVAHSSYIKEFLSYVEEKEQFYISEVAQPIIDEYVLFLERERVNLRDGEPLKETTINKHKNSLRKFWKYLHSEGVKVNAIMIKQKKSTERVESTVLSHEEIEQLYSVCDDSALGYRDLAMIAIYYGCGLRRSEGHRLLLTDVDFRNSRLHIRKTKNRRERYVNLSPTVQKQIEEYVYSYRNFFLSDESTYEEFFIGERHRPITKVTLSKRIEALWLRVKDQYGSNKRIGLHSLRHSLGTHLYMQKIDIKEIALMLGQSSLEATEIYIHLKTKLKQ